MTNELPTNLALRDLATRCSSCGCRIDRGDLYRITPWPGGFDYAHADCAKSSHIPLARDFPPSGGAP